MDLLIIAGFLGSGKTSLLLQLVEGLADGGARKIAIIENEIGAVGVDDQVLVAAGLPVREIYSGCICCSLRGDLITTLLDLERQEHPDLVILEPSGAAGVRQVHDALVGYGGEINARHTLCLLDTPRLGRLESIMLPFITNGINAADLVLMNKIDAVSPEAADALTADVRAIRADADILRTSTTEKTGLAELSQWLKNRLDKSGNALPQAAQPSQPSAGEPADDERPAGATVWSKTMRLESADGEELAKKLTEPSVGRATLLHAQRSSQGITRGTKLHALQDEAIQKGEALTKQLAGAMEQFVIELQQRGCSLIGHVKCVLKGPGAGFLLLSITDFNQPVSVRGKLASTVASADLTINAIVFGVESEDVDEAFQIAMG